MTKEEFLAWRGSPATEPFLKYLADRRDMLMQAWANGNPTDEADQTEAMMCGQIIDLEWKDVAEFYGIEEEETDGE